ncbi:MAG: hypothetical protein DHS20C21_13590 [Gemmatimonadota bacterium]|nr:MAG: hypothetical protein DHS20C21_13590 [Gemmatimonadota bacterium]
MSEFWNGLVESVGGSLPGLLYAVGFLLVGWLVATLIAGGVRAALRRTTLDDRLASLAQGGPRMDVSGWVSRTVFYLLMLFVVVSVLQILDLHLATEPLNGLLDRVLAFLPGAIGAAILLGVAWLVATLLRKVVGAALRSAKLDEKVAAGEETSGTPLASSISEAAYWLIFLLFLPAILGALKLEGLLIPVQNVMNDLLGYLPNILGAVLIGLLGWFIAGVVRRIVTSLLGAAGVDRLGENVGLAAASERRVSGLLGLAVYVLVLVPVLISALNALELDAITGPATQMLYVVFDAVPLILGSALVLLLAFFVGRFVSGLVTNLLQMVGFDKALVRMGLLRESADVVRNANRSPSVVVGRIVLVAIVLFAAMEAADLLGFEALSGFAAEFLSFAGHVLTGLVVFALGFALANWTASVLRSNGTPQAATLARVAQVAIIVFAAAIGLRRTGLANDIVDLAFGLLLGAVAVAAAIAFGIGGREVAARQMSGWFGGSKSVDRSTSTKS